MRQSVVLPFQPIAAPILVKKPYSLDELSAVPVNGMVLIEACIPVGALVALRAMLESGVY